MHGCNKCGCNSNPCCCAGGVPFSMMGAMGPQGPAGIQGNPGAQGPQGPQGPPGTSPNSQLFANAIFVDSDYGNDTNAVAYSLMDSTTNATAHKFSSINAALTLALTLNPKPAIIVYPGNYNVQNIYGNGINYYFYPGAQVNNTNITGAIFESTVGGESCKVFGKANFNGGQLGVIKLYKDSFLQFEANNIDSQANTVYYTDGKLTIKVRDITSNTGSGIFVAHSLSGSTSNYMIVNATTILNFPSGANVGAFRLSGITAPGFIGSIKITADNIIGGTTADVINLSNNRTLGISEIEINSNITTFNGIGTRPIVNILGIINTNLTINGNTTAIDPTGGFANRIGVTTAGINTGSTIVYNGNITSDSVPAFLQTGSNEIVHLNGTFKSNTTSRD